MFSCITKSGRCKVYKLAKNHGSLAISNQNNFIAVNLLVWQHSSPPRWRCLIWRLCLSWRTHTSTLFVSPPTSTTSIVVNQVCGSQRVQFIFIQEYISMASFNLPSSHPIFSYLKLRKGRINLILYQNIFYHISRWHLHLKSQRDLCLISCF